MAKWKRTALMAVVGMLLPQVLMAQAVADQMNSLHSVLEQLYDEMMPLCEDLIVVGQAIAGFAALWYIASRVWRHLANAEPVDFYPLFRPFVLGFCILNFSSVLFMINGVMKPTVTATAKMVEGSNAAIAVLLKDKEEALKKTPQWEMYVGDNNEGNQDKWYRFNNKDADPDDQNIFESIGSDIKFMMAKSFYRFQNSIKQVISLVLRVVFEAASLCIDTLRTFQLLVLSILGPLVFGLAVFDGLQHTLTAWLSRYLNIFLWLPVANILGALIGKIQEQMLKLDMSQIAETGSTSFSATDIAYMVFLIIGIVGYATVPSVANSIIAAQGGDGMLQKITRMTNSGASAGASATGAVAAAGGKRLGQGLNNIANFPSHVAQGYYAKDKQGDSHQKDKLSGKA